ncbi:hypothetical protein OPV22_003178 [Ensete ventricosum]|uniref:Regulatory protein RecX n=1 Tax=Ensete ventricosum TaxID=4639 RepID=A0AAV8S048_ENSVE|nr:hypothetical protein OPV22_003178 [Ensete ventricosum]
MDSPAAGEKEGEIWNQERGQGRLVDRDFVGRGYCDLVLIARSTGDSYGKPNLLSHDTDPKKDAAFSFCELINSEKERRVRQGSDIFLSFTCEQRTIVEASLNLELLEFDFSAQDPFHRFPTYLYSLKILQVLPCKKGWRFCNKALKLASSVRGVESVAIQGRNRNRVVVTGEGVASVYLTSILRKNMGYAEIIGISRVNIDEVHECEVPGLQEVPQCYNNYCGPPQLMSNGVCNTHSNGYNHYYPAHPHTIHDGWIMISALSFLLGLAHIVVYDIVDLQEILTCEEMREELDVESSSTASCTIHCIAFQSILENNSSHSREAGLPDVFFNSLQSSPYKNHMVEAYQALCHKGSPVPDSGSSSCPNPNGKLLRQEKMAFLLANPRFQISLHGQFRCAVISSWVKNSRYSSGRVRCIPGEFAKINRANFSHLKIAKEKETYPTETVSSKNIKFHGNFSRNNHTDAEGASSSGIFDRTEELLEFKDVSSYSLDTMEDAAEKEFELCPGEEQDSDIPKIAETGEVTKSRTKQDAEQMAIELLSARAFTTLELRKKLRGKKFSLDIVDPLIASLKDRGLINDGLYAESFSHSRWLSMTWGPQRIKKALRQKGVSEMTADKATKEVFEEDDTGGDGWNIQHGISKHSMERLYLQASKQWLRSRDSSLMIRKPRIIIHDESVLGNLQIISSKSCCKIAQVLESGFC